jgi:hypothetical protein
MRKPWWVRAVGLLGWVCAALWVGVILQKPTPQTALGQLVLFGVLPYVVLGLWLLWGAMSFVLYVVGRAGRQNAAILRDVMAEAGKPFPGGPVPAAQSPHASAWDNMAGYQPTGSASTLGPRDSATLDQISLNSAPRPSAPVRQTGSVFGLTLGQQPRAVHPPKAVALGAEPASETPPGPKDIPFGAAGPPGQGSGRKGESSLYTYEAPGLPLCPECGVRPVIFYCTRHSEALCLECVVRHDRLGECTYVPGWRGEKSEAH